MRHRITGIVAGAAMASAVAALGVASAGAMAATHPAAQSRVAVARPYAIRLGNAQWGQAPTTAQCLQATGFACYRPSQFRQAYNLKPLYAKGLTGKGETIVLVDSFGSPTIRSDLATFDKTFGIPAPPSFKILQPAGKVPPYNPKHPDGWVVETSLDVEYSHAMAPGANIVLLETPVAETEGTVGFPQIVKAENYAIDHHIGDVISQSFGATEQTFPSESALLNLRSAYKNAAAHNVSVLASTGDTGATNYSNAAGTRYYTHRVVAWPASDPLVTAVGGLQLHLNSQGDETQPDNVWNETYLFGSPVAGVGGVSAVFGRPSYQNSLRSLVGLHRGVPDISLSAAVNGGALVYVSTKGTVPKPAFYIVGGTSEASPQFAGIVAIADQAAGHDLGLLNPKLYALGSGSAGIPDVTIGNNTVTFSQSGHTYTVGGYNAGTGYDLASGLGTVNAASLVAALAGSSS